MSRQYNKVEKRRRRVRRESRRRDEINAKLAEKKGSKKKV